MAAGREPPMTQPKKRPLAEPMRPPWTPAASSQRTCSEGRPWSPRGFPRRARRVCTSVVAATEAVSRFSRWDCARVRAAWSALGDSMGGRVEEEGKRVYPERDSKLKKKQRSNEATESAEERGHADYRVPGVSQNQGWGTLTSKTK